MLVSKYFKLNRNQATLDFLDVHIDKDIPVFVDPAALRSLQTDWGHHCVSLLQNYFESVLTAIRKGKHDRAKELLACLNERNEFHIGFSKKKSRGHALGQVSAEKIWSSIVKSKAVQTGAMHDLEDTILFVDGVGPDMLSDAVCNIIRGPLIQYTQQSCNYYGIPLTTGVDSGPVWNTRDEKWESSLISRPMTTHGPVSRIPKVVARVKATGTNTGEFMGMPATGKPIMVRDMDIVELDAAGKCVSHWSANSAGALLQIGYGSLTNPSTAVVMDVYGKFGKGDVRGVIAPETAHHPVKGGDPVPTVAFTPPRHRPLSATSTS